MKTTTKNSPLGASFRDPSGFLFTRDGVLYRQVNQVYAADYDRLMTSGLYAKLVETGRLIPHEESDQKPAAPNAYKILRPERVPFISYPYEWSFGQLKDAALATLSIQKRALKYGVSLKDASAYNIQFFKGKAALIDSLSFESYQEGEPWVAYRQFCQHFLAPLALMAYRDVRLVQLLRVYIDGIPLDLASELLPSRTRWNLGLASHIHLHAQAQKKYSGASIAEQRRGRKMSQEALLGLIESLQNTVRKLAWKPAGTEWGEYYDQTNYSVAAFEHKKQLVAEWAGRVKPRLVWDLGANTGIFTRQALRLGSGQAMGPERYAVAWDIDPAAVEQNWMQVRKEKEQAILPLVLDLTNPSPALGWDNRERESFGQRGPADLILALALIHHLAISNNLPFERIAESMAGWGKWLVIEFVPKSDSQVQKLLRSRKDIFDEYTRQGFEAAFERQFEIVERRAVRESERWMYLMRKSV
ncbi:MAG: class I SAM-dependent methyltransferase [Chloroflexota bacterium]